MPGREPRGAIEVLLRDARGDIRVVTTHLGIKASERRKQVGQLLRILHALPDGLVCLMGDFNHWLPRGGLLSGLNRWFGESPWARTFPARLPLLPLDRIWVRPVERLARLQVHAYGKARSVSDHLPLKAILRPF